MISKLLLIISQIPSIIFLLQNDEWDQRLIGLAFGYSALSCFILTASLSFRDPLMERLFGGLDKLYRTHHLMGLLTVSFIVIHILLIFLSSESISFFLDPTVMSFDYLSGWLSLILVVTVIILASSLSRGHKLWRAIHLLSIPAYFLGFYHFYSLSSIEGFFKLALIVVFFFGLFLMLLTATKYLAKNYVLEKVEQLSESVVSLSFRPLERKMDFKPSQFLFVSFKSSKNYQACSEFHPFTITSSPSDEFLEVIVKSRGDCSCRIQKIKEGVHAKLDGPYGGFKIKDGPQVWIGGGIGITPFISLANEAKFPVDLYYVVKKQEDLVLLDRLKGVAVHPVIIDDDIDQLMSIIKSPGFLSKNFILSGPPLMVKSLKERLLKEGVPEYNIQHETCGFNGFI